MHRNIQSDDAPGGVLVAKLSSGVLHRRVDDQDITLTQGMHSPNTQMSEATPKRALAKHYKDGYVHITISMMLIPIQVSTRDGGKVGHKGAAQAS